MQNNRIEWVDISKGIAMLLVMIGHSGIAEPVNAWLYSFHMPLFFFLSGYVFSVNKYKTFGSFFRKKFSTLFIPLLIFGIVIKVWQFVFMPTHDFAALGKNIILSFLLELRGKYSMTLWFLLCLFFVQIEYWFVLKITKHNVKSQLIILTAASIIGYMYLRIVDKIFPWCLDTTLFAIGFFGIGYIIRNNKNNIIEYCSKWTVLFASLAVNILTVVVNWNLCYEYPNLYANEIGIYPLFYIGAFSGIIFIIALVNKVRCKLFKLFDFMGKNSITFYAVHKEIFFYLFDFFVTMLGIQMTYFYQTQIKAVVYVLLALPCCMLSAIIVKKYCPWIIGTRQVNRRS